MRILVPTLALTGALLLGATHHVMAVPPSSATSAAVCLAPTNFAETADLHGLGLDVAPITPEAGVAVTHVAPGSAADNHGVHSGDVVREIEGRAVSAIPAFARLANDIRPGQWGLSSFSAPPRHSTSPDPALGAGPAAFEHEEGNRR
jgi:S1-C subfamily serine protease